MLLSIVEDKNDYMNEEYDIFDNEIDEYNEKDYNESIAIEFEKDIRKFLNDIISLSYDLKENFTSPQSLRKHFNKHCLGHNQDKVSTRGRIYYDFDDISNYVQHERLISDEIRNTNYKIDSLYDYDTILRYMRKLFEGGIAVVFTTLCGICKDGAVSVTFHSFSSNITKNYSRGNTIDLCIKNARNKTISLYPIDAYDVERRLNNTLANYSDYSGEFYFNHQ